MIPQQIKLILLALWSVALVSLGGIFAWKWQEVRYIQREEQLAQEHIKELEKVNLDHERYIAGLEQSRAAMIKHLQDKLDENARLNADVDAARKRLRILVLGQKSCSIQSATDAGGTEPVAAELDAVARQAYFDLRAGIIKQEALLGFCINHVRNMSAE